MSRKGQSWHDEGKLHVVRQSQGRLASRKMNVLKTMRKNDCSAWVGSVGCLGKRAGHIGLALFSLILAKSVVTILAQGPSWYWERTTSGQTVLCFSFAREAGSGRIARRSEAEDDKKRLPRDGEGGCR